MGAFPPLFGGGHGRGRGSGVTAAVINIVDIQRYYNTERLRPQYKTLMHQPLFIMTSDV